MYLEVYPKEDDTITSNPYKISRNREIRRRKRRMQKETPRIEETKCCPTCKSTDLTFDSQKAELSCRRCGHVIEDSGMDMGPEWRAYDREQRDKLVRVGPPSTLTTADKGLNTTIDRRNKDINGRNIPEGNKDQYRRMRKINERLRISRTGERNLAIALGELNRECSRLGLPKHVKEDTSLIYRTAAKKNLVSGRSIEGIMTVMLAFGM